MPSGYSAMTYALVSVTGFLVAALFLSFFYVRASAAGPRVPATRFGPPILMWALFGAMAMYAYTLTRQASDPPAAAAGAMALVPGATLIRDGLELPIVGADPCPARELAVSNHPIADYAPRGAACVSLGGPAVKVLIADASGATHTESLTVIRLGGAVWLRDHRDQLVFHGMLRGGPPDVTAAIQDNLANILAAAAAASAASAPDPGVDQVIPAPASSAPQAPLRPEPKMREPVDNVSNKV